MGNCQTQSTARKEPVFFNQSPNENAPPPIIQLNAEQLDASNQGASTSGEGIRPSSQLINVENTKPNEQQKSPIRSGKATDISKQIDEQLIKDHRASERVVKLLLLGPSESGKSTVLKQMKIIHCNGFTPEEMFARRSLIFLNIVQSMSQLLIGMRRLSYKLPLENEPDAAIVAQALQDNKSIEMSLPNHVYHAVKKLWAEPKILEVYERRSEFHLIDCAKYFLDDLDRIRSSAYIPTVNDILHARMETIGVVEIKFSYKDMSFRIFDVGGQKNERRKWIHIFDNVNALFFLAAISEYDQVMREDSETNRLHDAMELFSGIGNNPLFTKVQIILFLNKQDLFAEKIQRIPLTACFPNYRYKNDFKNTALYITRKFEKQIRDKSKMIYTHLTCATDTSHLTFLMNSIIDFIIAENFKSTGVL